MADGPAEQAPEEERGERTRRREKNSKKREDWFGSRLRALSAAERRVSEPLQSKTERRQLTAEFLERARREQSSVSDGASQG